MDAGQLAALIAAAFFAVGVGAAVFVLARLARLIAAATSLVTSYQAGADDLLARTRAAVERADEQLARTGALADSVDQVNASMSELSEQVSAVAGTARLIAAGLGAPVLRLAAAGHGIRHALAIRRSGQVAGLGPRGEVARAGLARASSARPGLAEGGMARLRALPERAGPAHAGTDRPASGQLPRETWRERTERVRAARDRVQR
jgi:uncharacterized protein YoxC